MSTSGTADPDERMIGAPSGSVGAAWAPGRDREQDGDGGR
jgi:hypothetical protein